MRIINSINGKELNMLYFEDELKCTSATIFYENKIPYIDWKGTTILPNGCIADVHIPKMSLDINEINIDQEELYFSGYNLLSKITKSRQIFVREGFKPDEDIIITIREKEMTKEQIEKELGYKVKIKE